MQTPHYCERTASNVYAECMGAFSTVLYTKRMHMYALGLLYAQGLSVHRGWAMFDFNTNTRTECRVTEGNRYHGDILKITFLTRWSMEQDKI